jgi:type IV pilus assembly protein PilE
MVQPEPNRLLEEKCVEARKRSARGFTLIELMIVVAIVAILSAIAYPAYTSHIRKGRRAEVQAMLMDMAQREIQYFTDTRTYALDAGGTMAYTTLHVPFPSDLSSYYTVTTAARSGVTPSFQVTATALNDQTKDKAAGVTIKALTIDDTGAKATVDTSNNSLSSVAW